MCYYPHKVLIYLIDQRKRFLQRVFGAWYVIIQIEHHSFSISFSMHGVHSARFLTHIVI